LIRVCIYVLNIFTDQINVINVVSDTYSHLPNIILIIIYVRILQINVFYAFVQTVLVYISGRYHYFGTDNSGFFFNRLYSLDKKVGPQYAKILLCRT